MNIHLQNPGIAKKGAPEEMGEGVGFGTYQDFFMDLYRGPQNLVISSIDIIHSKYGHLCVASHIYMHFFNPPTCQNGGGSSLFWQCHDFGIMRMSILLQNWGGIGGARIHSSSWIGWLNKSWRSKLSAGASIYNELVTNPSSRTHQILHLVKEKC